MSATATVALPTEERPPQVAGNERQHRASRSTPPVKNLPVGNLIELAVSYQNDELATLNGV
jgi:hypothetical protein